MGVEKQRVSMRWGRETVEQADFLLDEFGGLIEDQSHLSRIAIRWAYVRVNTIGIVKAVEEFLQGKHCTTSLADASDADADRQSKTEFPVAQRTTGDSACPGLKPPNRRRTHSAPARLVNGVSRRSYAEVRWAYNPPFISKIGPSKFIRSAA